MTDLSGTGAAPIVRQVVYTAFGERVWSDGTIGTRYQYAGAYGYQTMPEYASGFSSSFGGSPGDEVPFVHVGHRWYDPSTGRFLQSDPIGVQGGLNSYRYVANQPVSLIDPLGFITLVIHWREHTGDVGHTVLVTGPPCGYFSHVPSAGPFSKSYADRCFGDDAKRYGWPPDDIWLIPDIDEQKASDTGSTYPGSTWNPGRNCITATIASLEAGGAPPAPSGTFLPPQGRDYFDQIGTRIWGE